MTVDPAVLTVEIEATDGNARATTIRTARGIIRTPCFMPVGTRATVRALDATDLEALGVQALLANTYHLMLRPGTDVVEALGGLHPFMGWSGHIITDSGGYQVFSLSPRVDEEGVTFRSTYDGSTYRLTPEHAVLVQGRLGADIQMALDVCPALPAPVQVVRAAAERTARWAARARAAQAVALDSGSTQALFGIVQGGIDADLRRISAERTVDIGFDGYGIGGLSVGETHAEMLLALSAALEVLPPNRPRYLMGVGDPRGLVEAVALGVDLFDCVLPSRLGRHGTILATHGRFNLRNARWATDDAPLDPDCCCAVCARYSRGYLRHLLVVGEPTAARLCTLHNVAWLNDLVGRARVAIASGTLSSLVTAVAAVWSERRSTPC